MYIQTEWCESLVSAWTLLFVQWHTGGVASLANVTTSCVYQLEVLQQVQATSVNNLGMDFFWVHLSSVDHCSISWWATLVPAGHCQHQHVIWSHWSEVFERWLHGFVGHFITSVAIFSWNLSPQSFNMQQHNGHFIAFVEVLFPNREIPTEAPVCLNAKLYVLLSDASICITSTTLPHSKILIT